MASSSVFARAGRMYPLLEYLIEAELAGEGKRITQYAIAVDVFGRDEHFDPALDSIVRVEVGRLRNKLREYYAGEGSRAAVRVELPKGRYRPKISVYSTSVASQLPEGGPAGTSEAAETALPSVPRPPFRYVAAAVVAIFVLSVSAVVWLGRTMTGAPADQSVSGGDLSLNALSASARFADASPASSPLPRSVAVLPFESTSASAEHASFAAGMHETVLHSLERLRTLNVISRTSVQRYADERPAIRQIAAELGVESVLEGSVGFDGERVVVHVRLIDGNSDRQVWSGRYDRALEDIFAVQAELATSVAEALDAELSERERHLLETPPTTSPEAFALFLVTFTLAPDERFRLLDQALELDPDFALAHAFKAFLLSQSLTSTAFGPAAPASEHPRIEQAIRLHAERALAIDPTVPYANIALANLYFFTWRWTEARRAFERAAEAAPSDGALLHYAYLDSYTGRHEEAIRRIEALIPLNPNLAVLHSILGITRAHAGDRVGAVASLHTGLSAPFSASQLIERGWLASIEIARGNFEAALRELRLIEELGGGENALELPVLAHAYARLGRRADAERLLAEFERAASEGAPVGAGGWAEAYLAVGRYEEALRWLEIAARKIANHEPDEHFYALIHMRMNLLADPVLERPEFADVLRRITGE
jgi:TolB-like protein/Flp pilus assembly protein TadD